MANGTPEPNLPHPGPIQPTEPRAATVVAAVGIALVFVVLTRWPVARTGPLEPDEFSYLRQVSMQWFPISHTLFLTLARLLGEMAGDLYRGFILLDIVCSALALVSLWWWLRALVRPATALAATLLLGVGPVFWGYGAVAGNYTAIVLIGSFLLGLAIRGRTCPRTWHPLAAASVLAIGCGYRMDMGLFWFPIFLVILAQHRWKTSALALVIFAILNLSWIGAMLYDVGGWSRYRSSVAEFGHQAGTLNSVWHLGFIDGSVRYALKLSMALVWTLGPALAFVPRGFLRLSRTKDGTFLACLLVLSIVPALAFHLLIHFGVPGYSFHYIPALMAMVAIGVGANPAGEPAAASTNVAAVGQRGDRAIPRLIGIAALMASAFWFYPTDDSRPGWRGDFDLAFCRFTRHGLTLPLRRVPTHWRTANSRDLSGNTIPVRRSVFEARDFRSGSSSGAGASEAPSEPHSNERRAPSEGRPPA